MKGYTFINTTCSYQTKQMARQTRRKQEPTVSELLTGFVDGLRDKVLEETGANLSILEFIKEEVNLGIELTPQQRLILKMVYNIPLEEEEIIILDFWKDVGKANWSVENTWPPHTLVFEAGRRSGKSTLCSIICAYEFYCLCLLKSPQKHYNIAISTPIDIRVIATTADQTKHTIYSSIVGIFNNSKYFQRLVEQDKLLIKEETISYKEKLLFLRPGNSKSGSQVGGTIKCLVLDEAARMGDKDGNPNALSLFSNLGISCTPFKDKALRLVVSSAWYEGDALQVLLARHFTDPSVLCVKTTSWDVNPVHASRDNPLVEAEYKADPIRAALEFEGVRPATVSAFFDKGEIERAFSGTNRIKTEGYIEEEGDLRLTKHKLLHCDPAPIGEYSIAHLDPALKSDSYSLVVGRGLVNDKDEIVVYIDGVIVWEPVNTTHVSIINVGEVLREIHKQRPLRKVTADSWNSAETIERLRQDGINAQVLHFTAPAQVKMYDSLRQLLHMNRLVLPSDFDARPKVEREFKQIQLIRERKIDHPYNGSKDCVDGIAAVANSILELEAPQVGIHKKIVTPKKKQAQQSDPFRPGYMVEDARQLVLGKISTRRNLRKSRSF